MPLIAVKQQAVKPRRVVVNGHADGCDRDHVILVTDFEKPAIEGAAPVCGEELVDFTVLK